MPNAETIYRTALEMITDSKKSSLRWRSGTSGQSGEEKPNVRMIADVALERGRQESSGLDTEMARWILELGHGIGFAQAHGMLRSVDQFDKMVPHFLAMADAFEHDGHPNVASEIRHMINASRGQLVPALEDAGDPVGQVRALLEEAPAP